MMMNKDFISSQKEKNSSGGWGVVCGIEGGGGGRSLTKDNSERI